MEEKSLHVRVAEALGWKYRPPEEVGDRDCGGTVFMIPPDTPSVSYCNACRPDQPPHYDTDWSATGPVLERLNLTLLRGELGWYAVPMDDVPWVSENPDIQMLLDGHLPLYDPEPTPLRAACIRILASAAVGKSPKPEGHDELWGQTILDSHIQEKLDANDELSRKIDGRRIPPRKINLDGGMT